MRRGLLVGVFGVSKPRRDLSGLCFCCVRNKLSELPPLAGQAMIWVASLPRNEIKGLSGFRGLRWKNVYGFGIVEGLAGVIVRTMIHRIKGLAGLHILGLKVALDTEWRKWIACGNDM